MQIPAGTKLPVLLVADTREMSINDMPQYVGTVAILLGYKNRPKTWKLGFITVQDFDTHVKRKHGRVYYES